jgi:hypothetical protein
MMLTIFVSINITKTINIMKKYKPEITVDRETSTEPEDIFFAGNIVEFVPETKTQKPYIVMVVEHRFIGRPIDNKHFKGVILDESDSIYVTQGEYSESFHKDSFRQFHGTITIKV